VIVKKIFRKDRSKRSKCGTRTDPCGTPHMRFETYDREERWEENHLKTVSSKPNQLIKKNRMINSVESSR
jgi:hypothetical protein